VKKLKGDYFIFSANRLRDGKVIFLSVLNSSRIWIEDSSSATVFKKNEIEKYKEIVMKDEESCEIVEPYLVEVNKKGEISKLREKIRSNGLNFNIRKNVQIQPKR
tara:strand:- start:220 stop:534 length:315 start_codon:yes stop_codon:yes gene_type:complete